MTSNLRFLYIFGGSGLLCATQQLHANKVLNFNEKRLHWASVVRGSDIQLNISDNLIRQQIYWQVMSSNACFNWLTSYVCYPDSY